jgi:hypothetical protein
MQRKKTLIAALIIFFSFIFSSYTVIAAGIPDESASVNVRLSVPGCNLNAICEPILGETAGNCPSDCSAGPGPGGGGSGSSGGGDLIGSFIIENLKIFPDKNKAVITWTTRVPTQSVLFWGKTPEYIQGSLSEGPYIKIHSVTVANLTPATLYYFSISARSATGFMSGYKGLFTTRTVPDTVPPTNVLFLRAYPYQGGIALDWKNPSDPDFESVRIVRSPYRYPRSIQDGAVVYEGSGKFFLDTRITTNVFYYYAVFSRDGAGNYSGGAIARSIVYRAPPGNPIEGKSPAQFPPLPIPPKSNPISTSTAPVIQLGISDFSFIQKGTPISFVAPEVSVDLGFDLTVLSEDLPSDIEYVYITLYEKSSQYSYGFTKNTRNEWLTTIPKSLISTTTPFTITVQSKKGEQIVSGVFKPIIKKIAKTQVGKRQVLWYTTLIFLIIFIGILLKILFLLFKKRKEDR